MSSANVPLDQPPPFIITQPNYNPQPSRGSHGSVAPVVAVLVAITILGIVAAIVGRLCTGKKILGYGHKYDMESWAETKCSSCIDGRIHIPPAPRSTRPASAGESSPLPIQAQATQQDSERGDQQSPNADN